MWSFGCVVAYMLKGEMPFLDYSDADIILQIIKVIGKPKA
jgi:serine/threonine protein kinase